MRIISTKRLKNFWENPIYTDSEKYLREWIDFVKATEWNNSNEVLEDYPNADNVGNKRIVFNIKGNKYRLIVMFLYHKQLAYIRFIDTHKEYDKITDIKSI